METNSFTRIIYFIFLITCLDHFVRPTAALPNKRVRDDEILAIIARQAEFEELDVPFTDQITVVSGSAAPPTPVTPAVTTPPAPAAPVPPTTPAPPPATTQARTTAVVNQPVQTQPVTNPNTSDNYTAPRSSANTRANSPAQSQTTTLNLPFSAEAVTLAVTTSLSLPILRVTSTSASSSAASQSEAPQGSTGSSFFQNRTAVGATFGAIGGVLVLASIFILWCCYSRQSSLGRRAPSPDARSSFDATTGLITDNHNHRDTMVSTYDDKFTSAITSERGSLAARAGGMRGSINASPYATVKSVHSVNGNHETMGPPGLGTIDLTAGALLLKIPESLKKSEPENSKTGHPGRADNHNLGTPTRSEPRWSNSSQVTHTRPVTPVSSAPSLPPFSSLPSLPASLPAIPAAVRRRSISSGNASGFHYVRASERLTAAAQEHAREKEKEKELSRKASANSSLSNITKAKISAPIPHPPPKIEIVNAFLRNSTSSESFEYGEDASPRRSADTPVSGMLCIDRWSFPSSTGATDAIPRPESDINGKGVDPNSVNPFAKMNLKVGTGVLEGMNEEKEAGRGWSGGSLIDGVEWPDPPNSTVVWPTKH